MKVCPNKVCPKCKVKGQMFLEPDGRDWRLVCFPCGHQEYLVMRRGKLFPMETLDFVKKNSLH